MHGPAALSAAELIGVLWGSGTRGTTALDAAADALRRHEGSGRTGASHRCRAGSGARRRAGAGRPAGGGLRAGAPPRHRLAAGPLDGPSAPRRGRAAGASDGLPGARGAARRPAEHPQRRPAAGHRLPGQRVVQPGPDRRAVPRRRPPQCRRADPGPQPPVGRPTRRARTTCASRPRRSPPAACWTSSCWTI